MSSTNQNPTTIAEDFPTQESQFSGAEKNIGGSDIFKIHFTKELQEDGSYIVKCNYCESTYKFKKHGGYGSFSNHMRSKHANLLGIDKTQTQLPRYGQSSSSSQLFQYSDAKNREEIAKMISMEHLSFSFGEKVGFTNYCQNALNPSMNRVPRNTVKRTILRLYEKGKKDLIIEFQNINGRVSICSDIWTDHWQIHSYMGITCHWIDKEWKIQKRVIAFRVFDSRHTADNIYRIIKSILEEYRLLFNIFSIGFDNAASNTASISELKNICQPSFGGKFFHIRCACHVLNLCVQDGLKAFNEIITPIKTAISFLWSHPQVMKEWRNFCRINNRRPKKFPRDVPTRWNSTYELLNESYEYRDLLCTFISNNVHQVTLYPQHWDACSHILEILKVFNDATYTFSGVYYPTSHLFLVECLNIVGTLHDNEDDVVLKDAITVMKRKWCHYYKKISSIYLVSLVFDPRCKVDGLNDYLTSYYECIDLNQTDSEYVDISRVISEVRNTIMDLYNEYNTEGPSIGQSSYSQIQSEPIKISKGDRILMQRQKKPRGSSGSNSEFDIYLTTVFEFGDSSTGKQFPVLEWWSRHANTFPTLAKIAKQLLAVPVSTVAVEQAFSALGSILDETRSTMSPESLEAQACLDDWTRAELRQQEIQQQNIEDLYDLTTTDGTMTGTSGGNGSD